MSVPQRKNGFSPEERLLVRYKGALREFLGEGGESALQDAYELGRQAMADGLGALDLTRIHKEALLEVIEEQRSDGTDAEYISKASAFFAESLATFEMTHRGFQEALAVLSTRSAELEATNKILGQEIAERRRIQDALEQSEEQYRDLVDQALDVIYTLSAESTITSLNPAFERITGWSREEWIGRPFLPLVHPDDVERCVHIYEMLLRGQTPPMFELRVRTKSGEYIHGEFMTRPQFKDGKVVGVLGIGRDVTKRRKAEDELRASQMQLAEAQQIAHLGNWEWDIRKGTLSWSVELYNIFGVNPENFTPTIDSWLMLVHPEDRDRVRAIIDQALKDKRPFRFHHRLIRPNGAVRISHSRGIVVTDLQGNPVKMFGTGQDVTEAKMAEEVLRELPNKILAAQEAERRRLARELHDDVCQRLMGMKLSIDLIEDDLGQNTKGIKKITLAKEQIDRIITDIRRISWNLRPTTLDDLGLVVAIRKLCDGLSSTYRKTISFSVGKNIPRHLDADMEIALYRIVQESVMNALKHARCSIINVRLRRIERMLVVTITDNGRGFKGTSHREAGPTGGLGIASMKERAHLLHGALRIVSREGKGTRITMKLPLEINETH